MALSTNPKQTYTSLLAQNQSSSLLNDPFKKPAIDLSFIKTNPMPTSYSKSGLTNVAPTPNYSTAPATKVATPTVTPSTPSATSTKGVAITAPAAKNYIDQISSYSYGQDVRDSSGNVVGQAKFDPNTGQPLTPPTQNSGYSQINPTASSNPATTAKDDFISAYKAYQDAQTANSDVERAKQAYNDYLANISKSKAGLEGQGRGIPLTIVRGQQEKLLGQTQPELARLQGDIGIAQDIYNQKVGAAKSGVDLQGKLLDLEGNKKSTLPAMAQEYEYAKQQGYTGSFTDYQNEDANRKKVQEGLTPAQINSTVNSIAGAFDNEPIVKEYNTVKTTLAALQKAGTSPTDDIQRIYAFAKIMDPNSVVREGEYKTVQDYSMALMQRLGINVARAFDTRGFLTPEARSAMATTLNNILTAKQNAYNNLQQQYQRQIDDAYQGKNRTITDYTGGGQSSGGSIWDW